MFFGNNNNCCWIILLVILIACCCGGNSATPFAATNGTGCGCGNTYYGRSGSDCC